MISTQRVLSQSLLRSLVCSHRSLIRLPRTASCARALRCDHSFARSLTPKPMGKRFMSMKGMRRFHTISTHCGMVLNTSKPQFLPIVRCRRQSLGFHSAFRICFDGHCAFARTARSPTRNLLVLRTHRLLLLRHSLLQLLLLRKLLMLQRCLLLLRM